MLKSRFYLKTKKSKTFNTNIDDKYTKLFKPNVNILKYNYYLSVRDNVWELWLFVREFPIAAEVSLQVNPSRKLRFI